MSTNHTKTSCRHASAWSTRTLQIRSKPPTSQHSWLEGEHVHLRHPWPACTMMLLTNDMHFRSPFNPVDAPESLFYRIEQCTRRYRCLHMTRTPTHKSSTTQLNCWCNQTWLGSNYPQNIPSSQDFHQRSIHSLHVGNAATQYSGPNGIYTPKSEHVQRVWRQRWHHSHRPHHDEHSSVNTRKHHHWGPNSCNPPRIGSTSHKSTKRNSNCNDEPNGGNLIQQHKHLATPPIQHAPYPTTRHPISGTMCWSYDGWIQHRTKRMMKDRTRMRTRCKSRRGMKPRKTHLPTTCAIKCRHEAMEADAEKAVSPPHHREPERPGHQQHLHTNLTSWRVLPTGMYATCVGSLSRKNTWKSSAPRRGADPTTKRVHAR